MLRAMKYCARSKPHQPSAASAKMAISTLFSVIGWLSVDLRAMQNSSLAVAASPPPSPPERRSLTAFTTSANPLGRVDQDDPAQRDVPRIVASQA